MRAQFVGAAALGWLLLPPLGHPALAQPAETPASLDLAQPARILKVMKDSKLRYDLGSALKPDAKPVEEVSCRRRVATERVVVGAQGEASLQAWQPTAAAAPHFAAAEKLFNDKQYPEAAVEYRKLLELDPDFGPGWLYSGDIPFGSKDYEAALRAYRKAIALDPTLASAHRFAADALLKLGRLDDAETEYVRAIAFDPAYDGAWQGLQVLGKLASFQVFRPDFSPPEKVLGERQGKTVSLAVPLGDGEQWLGYIFCKAVWRNEESYRIQRGGEKAGKPYSWSSTEEQDCLESYLAANLNRIEGTAAELPPLARHLKEVYEAGQLEGFIAVAVLAKRCPLAASLLPDPLHTAAERYIRTFVIQRPKS